MAYGNTRPGHAARHSLEKQIRTEVWKLAKDVASLRGAAVGNVFKDLGRYPAYVTGSFWRPMTPEAALRDMFALYGILGRSPSATIRVEDGKVSFKVASKPGAHTGGFNAAKSLKTAAGSAIGAWIYEQAKVLGVQGRSEDMQVLTGLSRSSLLRPGRAKEIAYVLDTIEYVRKKHGVRTRLTIAIDTQGWESSMVCL